MNTRVLLAGLAAATAASLTGFLIHVGTLEWVQSWVSDRMQGQQVSASWDVRYLALATSLEVGIGLTIVYALIRRSLPFKSSLLRGALLAALLLAVMGRLVRQPLMNLAIGNPPSVVLVQDGISWATWLVACMVLTVAFDRLAPESAA